MWIRSKIDDGLLPPFYGLTSSQWKSEVVKYCVSFFFFFRNASDNNMLFGEKCWFVCRCCDLLISCFCASGSCVGLALSGTEVNLILLLGTFDITAGAPLYLVYKILESVIFLQLSRLPFGYGNEGTSLLQMSIEI